VGSVEASERRSVKKESEVTPDARLAGTLAPPRSAKWNESIRLESLGNACRRKEAKLNAGAIVCHFGHDVCAMKNVSAEEQAIARSQSWLPELFACKP